MKLSERLRAKFTSLEVVREVEVLEAEIESLNRSLRVHMEGYLDAQAENERRFKQLYDMERAYLGEVKIRLETELENERLEDEINIADRHKYELVGDLNEQSAEIERLQRALDFYADPETYFGLMVLGDPPCGAFADDFSDDHEHPYLDGPRYGKVARAALAGKEGEE